MLKPKIALKILTAAVVFSLLGSSFSFAITSSEQKQIIKNCDRIKETLKGVQRTDISSRTYLGSVYDEILNDFFKPINVRLIKNNIKNDDLTENQDAFVTQRADFSSDFVTYSQSLEKLLTINCKETPKEFYATLEIVRSDRERVNLDVKKLDQLIEKQKTLVSALKEKKSEK